MSVIQNAINILSDADCEKDIIFNVTFFHDINDYDEDDVGERTYSILVKNAKEKYSFNKLYDICTDVKNEVSKKCSYDYKECYERHDFDSHNQIYVIGYDSYEAPNRLAEENSWDVWKEVFSKISGLECQDIHTESLDIRVVMEILHGKAEGALHHLERSIPKSQLRNSI